MSVLKIRDIQGNWIDIPSIIGATGATPSISIGTVSTGAAGTSAQVTVTGTAESPVLNFTIPRGEKGSTGDTGETGHEPVITAAKSNGVTTISVDGTAIATINDGDVGDSGVYIGDETPSDENVNVWIDSDGTPDVANNIIADEYSQSSTYSVGDYCTYDGDLYRCSTDISTAEAWTAAHWTQVTIGGEFTDLREDLDTKAETDGTYENLTAGQILSDNYTEDSVPYLLRPTGGAATQEYDEIVGGTVCWNQLLPISNSDKTKTENGVTITDNRDGTYTVYTDASGATDRVFISVSSFPFIKNHKYLLLGCPDGGNSNTYYAYLTGSMLEHGGSDIGNGYIYNASLEPTNVYIVPVYIVAGTIIPSSSPKTFKTNIHDLTQMFGSTIADYIYTLEQATAGSGIAKLKEWGFFTKDYYPYNTGALMSVKTSGHKTTVNNQEHLYPLSDIELRGVPKLDSGNNLYYDGDTYESDGTVTRKYGVVDLGTLNWQYSSSADAFKTGGITDKKNGYVDFVCEKYGFGTDVSSISQIASAPDATINFQKSNINIFIRDTSYSDDEVAFKAAMSGVMLVYALAESITETTDPFASPQFCDEYGTEEYIDTRDVPIPVGHNTRYPENLKKKIEGLPWSAVSDVQVNGASVVADGVANIPTATATRLGVTSISNDSGLYIGNSGALTTNRALESEIKIGLNDYKPIVPRRQYASVFYGLAKAAGDTTQSASSNEVGTYTDDAKIKIQKMLGIYEAPWELIRYDTGTNATEADIDITVDGNGNAFELTDVRMLFWMPTQDTTPSKADYGRIFFYYDASSADTVYCGAISQGNRIIGAEIEQKGNMVKVTEIRSGTISAELIPYNTVRAYPYSNNNSQIWSLLSGQRIYSRIVVTKVTGTYGYVIYGKRKWS